MKYSEITVGGFAYLLVEGGKLGQLSRWAKAEGFNVGCTAEVMIARLAAAAAARNEPTDSYVRDAYDALWNNHFDTADVMVKVGGEVTVVPYGESARGQTFNLSDLTTGQYRQTLWTVLASQFVELRDAYAREVERLITTEYAAAPTHAGLEGEIALSLMRIGVIAGGQATAIRYLRIGSIGAPHFSGISAVTAMKGDARLLIKIPHKPFETTCTGGSTGASNLSMTAQLPSISLERLAYKN